MRRADVGEVAAIERGHGVEVEPLAHSDDRRVGAAQSTVRIAEDKFAHTPQVAIEQIHDLVRVLLADTDVVEERGLCSRAQAAVDQVTRLGQDRRRDQENLVGISNQSRQRAWWVSD